MALFTDGQINSLRDLQRYESGLLDVASAEQIDITAKMALAQDMIASELLLFLLKRTWQWEPNRRVTDVSDVAVTEPLRRWHALKVIALTYEDAYNNQLNDRYQGKWRKYEQRASEAEKTLYEVGVGLVWDPVTKAESPLLIATAGSSDAMTYYVRMTWINRAGQEGAPSDVVSLPTVAGTQMIVSPVSPPANAVGWNVYVGESPEGASLQNDLGLGANTDWVTPPSGLRHGASTGQGQTPDRYVVQHRGILRG